MKSVTYEQMIAAAARVWLAPRSRWMARAKRELTAFSPQMVELGLRELFGEIAAKVQELAEEEGAPCHDAGRPTVCHILSGNLPNAGIVSMVIGLLSGAKNIVKPATGDPMPRLFMESLKEYFSTTNGHEPAATARQRGEWTRITDYYQAYRDADIVVAYGTNATLAAIQKEIRRGQKFLGFGHRVSVGIVGRAIHHAPTNVAPLAARDVSMWDQQGCMSPQAFYVEGDIEKFAAELAKELEKFDRRFPRGTLRFEDSAAIARARQEWQFRGKVWASQGSTHWTVVLDKKGAWAPSPLNRFVFVRPLVALQKLPRGLKFSTLGISNPMPHLPKAERTCPLGEMQRPSLLEPVSRPRVWELRK